MKKLSVVIPCYNESKNIPLILERFAAVINRDDVELLLVDNGSNDDSPEILRKLLPDFTFARSIRVDVNQGYGFGILSGLRATATPFLGWTHADMQTDPYDVLRGLELLEKSSSPDQSYVKGLRRGRPLFDEFFTTGMSIFETLYMRASLRDINAQPNLFHRSFFETWQDPPHDFSLDLYALYLASQKRLQLIRFEVRFPERKHGSSSWNTGLSAKWKFIKRTLDFSFKLKRRMIP